MSINEICDYNIKISIIGDSGNGKTSLMNKFISGNFNENIGSTIGIDFRSKIINLIYKDNDKKIKIKIWDTAGQERFSDIIKLYYRDSDGIILTYDITNYESFLNLEKWIENIYDICDKNFITIILVGTKSEKENNIEIKKKVPSEELVNFLNKYDLKYYEVSSKEGKNIDLLFYNLAEIILEKINNKPKSKYSNNIHELKNLLNNDSNLKITQDSCCNIC
jgi:small GTP-binding protein